MCRIYTSYFAKAHRLDLNKYNPVAITESNPLNLGRLSVMIPDRELLNDYELGKISKEEFKQRYFSQLELRKSSIKAHLDILLTLRKDIVLMSHEYPNEFSYRHLLAEWCNQSIPILKNKPIIEYNEHSN